MPIQVIAVAQGFDNIALREIGDVFDMPDDVFERRPRLNEKGEPIAEQFYEPPHWFEPVDKDLKEKVEADRKLIRKSAKVPAIDPVRQQADALAEGRMLAIAQEAVRQEMRVLDEKEIDRRVQVKLAELKGKPDPTKKP